MAGKSTIKSGQRVERSGIYKSSSTKKRTTLDKGETAPPTPTAGEKWNLDIETNPQKK